VTVRFRTKVFITSLSVAAAALAIATIIIAWELRREERASIERRITDQALLISERLSEDASLTTDASVDQEADRLARVVDGRITLIAADGRVLGDSDLDGEALATVETICNVPKCKWPAIDGRASSSDSARRCSGTCCTPRCVRIVRASRMSASHCRSRR
jgi:hypothetical protein